MFFYFRGAAFVHMNGYYTCAKIFDTLFDNRADLLRGLFVGFLTLRPVLVICR